MSAKQFGTAGSSSRQVSGAKPRRFPMTTLAKHTAATTSAALPRRFRANGICSLAGALFDQLFSAAKSPSDDYVPYTQYASDQAYRTNAMGQRVYRVDQRFQGGAPIPRSLSATTAGRTQLL
jgi:hypothetical protein